MCRFQTHPTTSAEISMISVAHMPDNTRLAFVKGIRVSSFWAKHLGIYWVLNLIDGAKVNELLERMLCSLVWWDNDEDDYQDDDNDTYYDDYDDCDDHTNYDDYLEDAMLTCVVR